MVMMMIMIMIMMMMMMMMIIIIIIIINRAATVLHDKYSNNSSQLLHGLKYDASKIKILRHWKRKFGRSLQFPWQFAMQQPIRPLANALLHAIHHCQIRNTRLSVHTSSTLCCACRQTEALQTLHSH